MKLHRLRNIALGLIFLGFLVMYLGLFVQPLFPVMLTLGTLLILGSVFIYFRVGAMSMRIPTVECPNCGRMTKVIGTEDGCMYCRTLIRLEMDEEGELFAVENSPQSSQPISRS